MHVEFSGRVVRFVCSVAALLAVLLLPRAAFSHPFRLLVGGVSTGAGKNTFVTQSPPSAPFPSGFGLITNGPGETAKSQVDAIVNALAGLSGDYSFERSSKNGMEILVVRPKPGVPNFTKATRDPNDHDQNKDNGLNVGISLVDASPGRSDMQLIPIDPAVPQSADWFLTVWDQDVNLIASSSQLNVSNSISASILASQFATDLQTQGLPATVSGDTLSLVTPNNYWFALNRSVDTTLQPVISNFLVPEPGALLGLTMVTAVLNRRSRRQLRDAHVDFLRCPRR
jgi:hypothetical protein